MEKAVYFLTQAHKCLTMACQTKNEGMRDRLVGLASEWIDLALEREQMAQEQTKEPANVFH